MAQRIICWIGSAFLIALTTVQASADCALPDMRTDQRPGANGAATEVSVSFIVADLLGVDDVSQQLDLDLIGTFKACGGTRKEVLASRSPQGSIPAHAGEPCARTLICNCRGENDKSGRDCPTASNLLTALADSLELEGNARGSRCGWCPSPENETGVV